MTDEREERLRRASERLYEDTRLRENFTDEEAEKLLAWGFRQVEQEVDQTLMLASTEAAPEIETRLDAVRKTLHLVGRIVEQLPEASPAQGRKYVAQLVDALCEVDTGAVQVGDMLALESMVTERAEVTRDELFQQLLEIIRRPTGDGYQVAAQNTGGEEAGKEDADAGKLVVASNALAGPAGTNGEEEE